MFPSFDSKEDSLNPLFKFSATIVFWNTQNIVITFKSIIYNSASASTCSLVQVCMYLEVENITDFLVMFMYRTIITLVSNSSLENLLSWLWRQPTMIMMNQSVSLYFTNMETLLDYAINSLEQLVLHEHGVDTKL